MDVRNGASEKERDYTRERLVTAERDNPYLLGNVAQT